VKLRVNYSEVSGPKFVCSVSAGASGSATGSSAGVSSTTGSAGVSSTADSSTGASSTFGSSLTSGSATSSDFSSFLGLISKFVGVGLMGGGIGTLIFGVGEYWSYADNWLKFIISLIGLIAIIGITYWFNSKNWNVWKKK
jgi:hypothetical protein